MISGARLWDGSAESTSTAPIAVWVRDGRIEAVGAEAEARFPGGVHRRLPGRVLMPGLIDAHVHLELDPALRTPAEQLAVPSESVVRAMADRARAMLRAGITTARDCGGGSHREHALRARIDRGELPGPRLLCCGQPLTTPDGHCAFWGGVVERSDDVAAVVARQVEAGSDWIKVMATGGVFTPGSRARDSQFETGTLRRIVEVAGRAGRPVAAHCHGTAGIAQALTAGARTIEHASFAGPDGFGSAPDERLMEALAGAPVWVSPTVNAGWGRRVVDAEGRPTAFFQRMSHCLGRQREAGVRLIASTDAGIPGVEHDGLVEGLEAFARYAGLTRRQALGAATSEAARALGLEQRTGRLAPGLSADLLVLAGDPLEDWGPLRRPEAVVARGRWLDGEEAQPMTDGEPSACRP